mgnify:CR=1 FL=1
MYVRSASNRLHILAMIFFSLALLLDSSAQEMVKSVSNDGLEKVVRYNVASFTDVRDKKLEDVVAKMPGMSLSPFTYNGMSVLEVFINGIDMLNGDYSTVRSMKPEDVECIEITENYVYEKIMQGVEYSNHVSINVILKEEAKSKWSGSIKAGLGLPRLFSGEAQALNVGQRTQMTILLKADNTGLNFGHEFSNPYLRRVNSFLSVSPSLAPLSDQRTRLNNSVFGNINSTFHLKKDFQLNLKLSLHQDNLTASNYDETEFFQTEGESIQNITGKSSKNRQRELEASVSIFSNSERSYFKNETQVMISDQYGNTDITGTYPSKQNVKMKPFTLKNDFAFRKPIGKSILSVDLMTAYDSKPQCLTVNRMQFNLQQDIVTNAYTDELSIAYKRKLGKFSFSVKAGASAKFWNLSTVLTPPVDEIRDAGGVSDVDNDSRFSYFNANSDVSITYIDDRLQLEISTPLNYYRNFFDNFKTDERNSADRWHFAPSVSAKYQITNNLSVSANARGLNNGLLGGRIYSGLVMTDFQSFTQGNVNSKNDKSILSSASVSYRYPLKSFFVNGSYNRRNMNQELVYISKFTENFNISGYIPVDEIFKSITDRISMDISKGIASFKGKIGMNASFSNMRSSMNRNNVRLPYTSKSCSFGSNINGRLFNWLNIIFFVKYSHSNLFIPSDTEMMMASKSNELTQSLELIFSPWERFNISLLGDHYMNQIAEDLYKNVVILDLKAEFKINERWQLIASITNLLNQTTYNYILISNKMASSSYTSYSIRPRNLLLSVFFKF